MTNRKPERARKADKAEELEVVELKPRSSRGAVISVRLTSEEAQRLAQRAEKSRLSLSEFARRILRRATASTWRLMVWDGQAPLAVGLPPQTGGDYGLRSTDPATTGHQM